MNIETSSLHAKGRSIPCITTVNCPFFFLPGSVAEVAEGDMYIYPIYSISILPIISHNYLLCWYKLKCQALCWG